MRHSRRSLLRNAAATTVLAATFVLADTLYLTPSILGPGASVVAACQVGAFNAAWQPTSSAVPFGHTATTVTLGGMTATCESKPYTVTLYRLAGAGLVEATGTLPASFGPVVLSFASIDAASVTRVTVVISR